MDTRDDDGSFEIINGMKIPVKDNQKKAAPKRFYKSVFVAQTEEGFCVKLDQRILKSPEKITMIWPSRDLAQRVAQEWDFQQDSIKLTDMPLTALSYSSIGRSEQIYTALRDEMEAYAGSDLIIYRSQSPRELVTLQEKGWNPVLSWLETEFSAPFNVGQGIQFVEQPEQSVKNIASWLEQLPNENLPGLMMMTKLSGSLFLAMSVVENYISVSEAWALAMIDEDWQNSQWGQDEVQKQRRLMMNRDFAAAADFIKLFSAPFEPKK